MYDFDWFGQIKNKVKIKEINIHSKEIKHHFTSDVLFYQQPILFSYPQLPYTNYGT